MDIGLWYRKIEEEREEMEKRLNLLEEEIERQEEEIDTIFKKIFDIHIPPSGDKFSNREAILTSSPYISFLIFKIFSGFLVKY